MAFFTNSGTAPDVSTNKDVVRESVRFFGIVNKTYIRNLGTDQKELRGLTLEAADSAMAALASDTTVSSISRNAIGGGGYNVRYTVTTGQTYTEDT